MTLFHISNISSIHSFYFFQQKIIYFIEYNYFAYNSTVASMFLFKCCQEYQSGIGYEVSRNNGKDFKGSVKDIK